MKTARSNAVIMPNGEQSEHASRKGAMNGQMRPDNAMPIFHGTTGSDGLIPGRQQLGRDGSPSRVNALQQVLAGRTKHGSTQPCPRQQSDRLALPRGARLALAPHQAVEQTTGSEAKPDGSVSRASGFASARQEWQRAPARPTGPAGLRSRLDAGHC